MRALKTYVWSTLTYGCETWTLNKEALDKLEAFEMWTIRRMLRIPWTAKRSNQEVLQQADTDRELIKQLKKRQLRFMGHAVRKNKIELLSITGKIEGKRSRGRQRHKLIDRIITSNNMTCKPTELIRLAENRGRWKDVIAQVT